MKIEQTEHGYMLYSEKKSVALAADLNLSNALACAAIEHLLAELEALRKRVNELENADWLSLAHAICHDNGIPSGHIEERLYALAAALDAQRAGM
jgi:exopolyphosphatase/pppGpp-phosphohydrolase